MSLRALQKPDRVRRLWLALVAVFLCLHFVGEPLHLAAHAGAHDCALCQIIDTGAPAPQAAAPLPAPTTVALATPATAFWPAAPPALTPTSHPPRGPPSLLS